MKNMKSKTAQLIALSLAVLITMIGMMLPQSAMAQKSLSRAQHTPAEMEGFEAATSRSTANDMLSKEQQGQSQQEIASLGASQTAAPTNDMFVNAKVLNGTGLNVSGTNDEATLESGEPSGDAGNKTVWFKWQAPSNLSMTFDTIGVATLDDTVLGIYLGTAVNNLTPVATNDDINGTQNPRSRVTFIANAGSVYFIQVHGFSSNSGSFLLRYKINNAETGKQFDFDGATTDSHSDYAVFRPSDGYWYIRLSTGPLMAQPWGTSTDKIYPGDFDGDGSTDIGVWRPSNGTFYVLRSLDGTLLALQWGQNGDIPVQGDFDGDDKADFTVFRPTNGTFYVRKSTNGQLLVKQFGQSGDYVACGDYDGDGKTDFGVQRQVSGNGVFYILRSSDDQVVGQQFGLSDDNVVPGDYDGDGKNDIAVYRNSSNGFYALRSSDGGLFAVQWGASGDIIAPGHYVGDSKSDVTVFRPSTGAFYSLNADTNALTVTPWGANGDYPIARSNVH